MFRQFLLGLVIQIICIQLTLVISQETASVSDSVWKIIEKGNRSLADQDIPSASSSIDQIELILSNEKGHFEFDILIGFYSLKGRYLLISGHEDQWEAIYGWIKSNRPNFKSQEELTQLVRMLNNAGVAFKRLSRLNESRIAYLEATEVLKKLEKPDDFLYGSIYTNAGNSLKQLGEYERAIEYFIEGGRYLDSYLKDNTEGPTFNRAIITKGQNLNNLALAYQNLDNHKKAIEVLNQSIILRRKYDPDGLLMAYSNLVISLIEENDLSKADSILTFVINSYSKNKGIDRTLIQSYLRRAELDIKLSKDLGNIFRDLNSIKRTINLNMPQAKDLWTTASQYQISILLDQNKFKEALDFTNQTFAFISVNPIYQIKDNALPFDLKTNMNDDLITLMNLRAEILRQEGYHNTDLDLLKSSLRNYEYTIRLIDSVRRSLVLQSSKIELNRFQRFTYNNIINLAYDLFSMTRDSAYINLCFRYMEESKSAALWSTIQESDMQSAMVPADQQEMEKNLRTRIVDLQGVLMEKRDSDNPDQEEIETLERERFNLNMRLDSLINSFRRLYPNYYSLKYDNTVLEISSIRKSLGPGQMVLEYSITGNRIICIAITDSASTIFSAPFTTETEDMISFLVRFVKGRVYGFTPDVLEQYLQTGYYLYNTLLLPAKDLDGSKDIIIIPDGILGLIPFEILLTEKLQTQTVDYRIYPYLIKKKTVLYAYTASLNNYLNTRQKKPSERLLAVAPDYDMTKKGVSEVLIKEAGNLPSLEGIFKESMRIKQLTGGKTLLKSSATEGRFKEEAGKFSILHLAMHTLTNNDDPMGTSLVFTPGADENEDGLLYTREVYNLKLNATLTVLSSCETGSGQLVKGEGILSLARGFIYAGCPNLIMTLWNVDDASAQILMEGFYINLNKGNKIAEALQNSKLQFIENTDAFHSHPHFWAAHIELGQNQELIMPKYSNRHWIIMPVAGLLLLISLLLVVPRLKRRRDL